MLSITEYDKRQIELMSKQIQFYQQNLMSLAELIQPLEGLCIALQNINNEWKNNFFIFWDDLESVNADALDKSSSTYSESSQIVINNAIIGLQQLLDKTLTTF